MDPQLPLQTYVHRAQRTSPIHPAGYNPFIFQNRLYASILGCLGAMVFPGAGILYGREAEVVCRIALNEGFTIRRSDGTKLSRLTHEYHDLLGEVIASALGTGRGALVLSKTGSSLIVSDLPKDRTSNLLTRLEYFVHVNALKRRLLNGQQYQGERACA